MKNFLEQYWNIKKVDEQLLVTIKELKGELSELKQENAAQLEELRKINKALGTNEGHSAVDHIVRLKQKNEKLKDLISKSGPLRWAFHDGPDIIKEAGEWEKEAKQVLEGQ